MPQVTVPAGSEESKVIGELLVAAGKAGQQYRPQVLAYAGTFDAKVEAGIVVVEDAVIAKLPPAVQIVVKSIIGLVNTYVDANLATFEGDAYDALCNLAISEGTKLQA